MPIHLCVDARRCSHAQYTAQCHLPYNCYCFTQMWWNYNAAAWQTFHWLYFTLKCMECTGWPQKWHSFFGTPSFNFHQILADFQNYFTVRIRRKCVTILSRKIPPHLKCVATLRCEMSSVFKATIGNE